MGPFCAGRPNNLMVRQGRDLRHQAGGVQALGLHWQTLKKILEHEEPPAYRRLKPPPRPKIDPFRPIIKAILDADRMSREMGGAQIYLKREDLNHTGAHKINNTVGQALLAKRMGKRRIIAETGAGQHGVATATACARKTGTRTQVTLARNSGSFLRLCSSVGAPSRTGPVALDGAAALICHSRPAAMRGAAARSTRT